MKKENLIFKVVAPFLLSLVFIIAVTLGTLYYLQKKHITQQSIEKLRNTSDILRKTINDDTELLKELVQFLQKDEIIINYYKNRNREWLFLYLYQIYSGFNENHNITHLYIHNLDKTNFLRVHKRDMHSDKIERITLNKSFTTGAVSSGIEFGKNHDFTLRVVVPWYERGELIGYIELGKDIERISKEISSTLKTDIIFTINKEVNKAFNDKRYIQLDNSYIIKSTISKVKTSKELLSILNKNENISNTIIQNQEHIYTISSEPLHDASRKDVAKVHVLIDISDETKELNSIVFDVVLLLLLIMVVILFYYYRYIKQIDNILKKDKEIIEFNFKFEQYVNRISSDLLVNEDIDKSINNTLKTLGEVLNAHRAYLFIFKEDYSIMNNSHEWCADGVNPEIDNLKNESTKPFNWWLKQCKELKPIVIEDIDALPQDAKNEKESLQQQNIKSLMVYQLLSKGKLSGFIGIDIVNKPIKWSDTHHSFVKITAEAISVAFDKKADREKIIDAYDDISLTLNSASNGILVINEYGNVTLYNKNFINLWDIDESSIKYNTHFQLLKKLSYKILNYKQTSNSVEFLIEHKYKELTFMTFLKDGRIFEIVSLPRVKESIYKGRVFTFRDVTKKIVSERELELAAKVFENSLDGIIITDKDANIIKVNNSFLKITGYSANDIIGKKPSLFQSNLHNNDFYNRLWSKLQTDNIFEGEIKDSKKNGELYITLSTIISIKDREGNCANYIAIIRDITKVKQTQEQIENLAYYDSLTKLPNRTLFMDRFGQSLLYCKRNNRKSALMFIDLDNFKYVNDTYGHQIGDSLLKEVSRLLVCSVRTSDTVSRLSGDEFTIIVRNIDSKSDVITIANKIIEKFSKPIVIDDNISLDIGCSIGAAMYPDDAKDRDGLIKIADSAMYKAKDKGKNRLEFL